MFTLLKCLILFLLIAIVIQDFKSRAVYWFIFPLLFASSLLVGLNTHRDTLLSSSGLNLCFLAIQIFLVGCYFSLRKGRFFNILQTHIGLGDILFLIAIAPLFAFVPYVLFYVLSLGLSLISILIYILFKQKPDTIPLAGLQSLFLGGVVIHSLITRADQLFISDFILNILNK